MNESGSVRPITETDTIYEIVKRHPELKTVLEGLSPRFKKLSNPVVFNTVARTATVKDAARTGKLYLREMLYELNQAIGLGEEYLNLEREKLRGTRDAYLASHGAPGQGSAADTGESPAAPDWAAGADSFPVLDLRELPGDPFLTVRARAEETPAGAGLALVQSFVPYPLIRFLGTLGFETHVLREDEAAFRILLYRTPRQ
jgi:hypothetical protein